MLRLACSSILALALTPESATIADEKPSEKFMDKSLARLKHNEAVTAIAFSPDGRLLATASGREVRLWDTDTWKLVKKVTAHDKRVLCLRYSPDARRLATASLDTTVRLFDARTLKMLHVMKRHTAGVYAIDFSPDGEWMASGGADMTAQLWRTADGSHVRELLGTDKSPIPDDDLVQLAEDTGERYTYWDQARTTLRVLKGIHNVSFSLDGRMIALNSDSHSGVWFVDTAGRRNDGRVVDRDKPCKWIAFVAGDDRLAVEYSMLDEILLFELAEPAKPRYVHLPIPSSTSSMRNYCTSADRKTLVASTGRGLMFLDVATRKITRTIGVLAPPELRHTERIAKPIALAPGGRLLAGGLAQGDVVIRDVTESEPLSVIPARLDLLPFPERVSP